MRALLKKLHRWLGLLTGLQVLVWVVSGLVMSTLDPAKVSGERRAGPAADVAPRVRPAAVLEPAALPAERLDGALAIHLELATSPPVYRIERAHGAALLNALDGRPLSFGKAEAERLARADFSGPERIESISSGVAPDRETRGSRGDYWRVDFADEARTSIYVSAATGDILVRRNGHWRLFDFFWMLHIMDYQGREDINNALVVSVALVALWLGLSGFVLLLGSFEKGDFRFPGRRAGHADVLVTLVHPGNGRRQLVSLGKGSKLFAALAGRQIELPSICGGQGECGRCRVRIESAGAPPAAGAAEKGLIPAKLIAQGYRLACQQAAREDLTVYLPKGTRVPAPGRPGEGRQPA